MHMGSVQIDLVHREHRMTVSVETVAFNEKHKSHSMARLIDRRRAKVSAKGAGGRSFHAALDGTSLHRVIEVHFSPLCMVSTQSFRVLQGRHEPLPAIRLCI
jgi:hypothetical protein